MLPADTRHPHQPCDYVKPSGKSVNICGRIYHPEWNLLWVDSILNEVRSYGPDWYCTWISWGKSMATDDKNYSELTFTQFTKSRMRHHDSINWYVFLQLRNNGPDGVSNHQPHRCLLNRLFRCRSRKTLKLRVTGLCAENSPVTGEFPAHMARNKENVE